MLDHGNKSHRITMDQITNFAEALYMGEYGKGTIENYVRNIKCALHMVWWPFGQGWGHCVEGTFDSK